MSKTDDFYRVGVTEKGLTTLTLSDGHTTITMKMSEHTCEKLIRMLRATYTTEEEKNT